MAICKWAGTVEGLLEQWHGMPKTNLQQVHTDDFYAATCGAYSLGPIYGLIFLCRLASHAI